MTSYTRQLIDSLAAINHALLPIDGHGPSERSPGVADGRRAVDVDQGTALSLAGADEAAAAVLGASGGTSGADCGDSAAVSEESEEVFGVGVALDDIRP